MATAQEGKLSTAEKKTIEFGLAVAILTSGPWAGESTSKRSSSGSSGDPSCEQRASKQLRFWQGACLGGLAEVGSGTRPHPATTRDDRGIALAGRRRDNTSHGIGSPFAVADGGSGSAAAVEPMGRLLTSGTGSDLRALGAVALSGCRSDAARAVRKEALEGIWHGDCSPSAVSLFVREVLEQVVLCGQGVGSGQTYRHVLDLMVYIVEEVAETASVVAAASANAKTGPSQPHDYSDNDAASISRRMDVALAVSQAFDTTLVQLARGLRGGGICSITGRQRLHGNTTGGSNSHGSSSASLFTRRQRRRAMVVQPQSRQATALAQAGRAGLFLEAYEAVVACLGNAFSHLELTEHSGGRDDGGDGGADRLPPNWPPTGDQRLGTPNRTTTTVPERNMPAKHGMGWDAEARRNAWTQTKLEVLAIYRDGDQDPPGGGAGIAGAAAEDLKRPRAVSPSALPPSGPEVDDPVAAAASRMPAAATVPAGPQGPLYCSSPCLMEKAASAAREGNGRGVDSRGCVRARALCSQPEEEEQEEEQEEEEEAQEDQICQQQQQRYENKRFFGRCLKTAHCPGQRQQQQQQRKGGAAPLLRNNSSVSSTMSEPVDIPGARSSGSSIESGDGGDGADEEGWVSLWNTYTRLFPGTFTGCSPPGSAPPLDSPLYAASPPRPPPPMDASPRRRNEASGMASLTPRDGGGGSGGIVALSNNAGRRRSVAGRTATASTPDVRGGGGGGLLSAARASDGYPVPAVTPESGSRSRLPTTLEGQVASTPQPDSRSYCHRYQQPGEEEVVGDDDEILLDDDDDDGVPPRGYSWGQLSRMPLEEAGRKLGTFSAKGFSTGAGGGGGDGGGCLDVSDCDEGGAGAGAGAADSFEDDLDDNSDTDLELSEGLMFDLEM